MDAQSPSSVASLRSRLELAHIHGGPPPMVRRPSAQLPADHPSDASQATATATATSSTPTPRPLSRPPPPPLPSGPPRRPGAPSLPPRSPSYSSKLGEIAEPMDEPLDSPPPYDGPPLPPRRPTIPSVAPPSASGPPQLPPRAPKPAVRPKPATPTFVNDIVRKKPAARPANEARSLPPLHHVPPPIPATPWAGKAKEAVRRPSMPVGRTSTSTSLESASAESPVVGTLRPPPPPLPSRKSVPDLRSPPPLPSTASMPPLPGRPSLPTRPRPPSHTATEPVPIVQPPVRRNILSMGFGGRAGKLPSPPRTPEPSALAPPPVPVNRPQSAAPAINASTKPTSSGGPPAPVARPGSSLPSGHQQLNTACLKCRDFSHVDTHAARFPRHAYDDVQRLALDLTRPFGSETDKARAIFTWLHHNVRYDVDAFFNNNVQPSTPASTLRTGLAVCEGYAGLFAAMAMYSGLEAVVVGGHGKGFGWAGPNAGPMPPAPTGHAWNAVRIDNGVWQTIDPCWGAGHLCNGVYKQEFAPHHFTNTNEEFRKTHFPENPNQQFCERPITWPEYYNMEEGPQLYGQISDPEFNYGRHSVEPGVKVLRPFTRYRFRIGGACEHKGASNEWVLMVNNGQDEEVMMPDGRGGFAVEISTGAAGSKVDLRVLKEFNKKSARGVTISQWKNKRGANSWSYSGICAWEVGM